MYHISKYCHIGAHLGRPYNREVNFVHSVNNYTTNGKCSMPYGVVTTMTLITEFD